LAIVALVTFASLPSALAEEGDAARGLSGRRNCLCACHIPKAITTAPAKPNQVMAASLFHFRQANVAYWHFSEVTLALSDVRSSA
jgi:hypothetical protein